jgi:hypothetical protein
MRVAPFTISERALRQIEWIRGQYLEHFPDDPPAMAGVNLAQPVLPDGKLGPYSVFIAFWRRSEFKVEDRWLVQKVSGLDLVFPVPAEQVLLFVGKQIDYDEDHAFYLRDAVSGSPS